MVGDATGDDEGDDCFRAVFAEPVQLVSRTATAVAVTPNQRLPGFTRQRIAAGGRSAQTDSRDIRERWGGRVRSQPPDFDLC